MNWRAHHRIGKSLLVSILALGVLAACDARGSDAMRDYLERDGAWGWSNGEGCVDRARVWVIEGETLEEFTENRLTERYLLERRQPLYSNRLPNGSGPLEFVRWRFVGRNPQNLDEMGRQEMMFAIRGGPGRVTALVPRNNRSFTSVETRDTRQIDEPYVGDRLVHCDEYAAFND